MKTFSLDDDSVVVVIGSGASGAVVANSLAQQGINVVCLEAGKRLGIADLKNNEAEMFGKLTWLDQRIGSGQSIPHFPVWSCKTVGGTTLHWTATSLRFQAHELRARSVYGDIPDCSLVDWPITADELSPWYADAERLMGVTGTNDIDFLPGNNNYKVLEAGARAVGYKNIDTNNVAINPTARDGRGGCLQTGFCTSGCVVGAKWSTLYTEIPRAEETDHFELRPECMVTRINHNQSGQVTSVQYLDHTKKLQTQKAKIICVSASAVESTRLLLHSTSSLFPNGLANRSGMLGRNYMKHVQAVLVGEMPGAVNMHRGAHQAGIVRDEMHHDPKRGFSGGFSMLTVPFAPEILARLTYPGAWGEKITRLLENYRNLACIMIIGEDLPHKDNRITLHPEQKDGYGLPVPVVHYEQHPNSERLLRFAMQQAKKIYSSLGATKMHDMIGVIPAAHNMGTARMGTDPKSSVCNSWGQTHDISNLFVSDSSLFPSSGCENPTLTIVALARRQANYIAEQIKKGTI